MGHLLRECERERDVDWVGDSEEWKEKERGKWREKDRRRRMNKKGEREGETKIDGEF